MYGLSGERWLPEMEVKWLDGYEGSKPVRVGNAATDQVQLDIYGEIGETLYLARQSGLGPMTADGALGQARGARGVHQEPRLIGQNRDVRLGVSGGVQDFFICAVSGGAW